jgi:hydroxymethylglutaryl-CoA lyase
MSDLPDKVRIFEVGPREGFQIEPKLVPTADKVAFIEALAETGVTKINSVAFMNPKTIPGWADAEEVARAIRRRDGVKYTGLWLNQRGIMRALDTPLDREGLIQTSVSEKFSVKNTHKTLDETLTEQRDWLKVYQEHQIELGWAYIMTAFGYQGDGEASPTMVLERIDSLLNLANEFGVSPHGVMLGDTVGLGNPLSVERLIGAIREVHPDLQLGMHLHDTRGTGLANAVAALQMGVGHFEASCGGLGGCPFGVDSGPAGNIVTEELVYVCEEMGVSTGIDLEKMIECARMAERLVGHPLPSKLIGAR